MYDSAFRGNGRADNRVKHLEREGEKCRRLLNKAPGNAELLLRLSVIEQKLGRPAEAMRCVEKALVLKPESPEAWRRCAEVHQGQKRYPDAVHALKVAIELSPPDAATLYHLGAVLGEAGKLSEAADAYRRAISVDPTHAEAWNNLGNILEIQGSLGAAADCLEHAIALDPNMAIAAHNLGRIHYKLDRLDEAAALFRKAIALKPDLPEAFVNLGVVLRRQGQLEESIACCRQALDLRPNYEEALVNLGKALAKRGHDEETVGVYKQILSLKPDNPEVLNTVGSILVRQGKFEESGAYFKRAVEIKPDYASAVHNLGFVSQKLGHLAEAAAFYCKAIVLKPEFPEAFTRLGRIFRQQGRIDEALTCCRRALALRPDLVEALIDLANTLGDTTGQPEEMIALLERAVSLKSDEPAAHRNLGIYLLCAGRLEEGWREYEWRWRCEDVALVGRTLAEPSWRGEAAENKTLFLHFEQGFGDTIQFCRYAPLAAARGLRVVMMVQSPLVRLMGSLSGVEEVLGQNDPLPAFDYHCPLMSLPLAFGTQLESIPNEVPYLSAGREAVAAWKARLANGDPECLKVGLVWAGNPRTNAPVGDMMAQRRAIPPEKLAPLLDIPGVRFYSLQKDGPPAPAEYGWVDFMGECRDFADTAALIANLDLVVSVDTSVVHLAGALGKPVWVMSRFDNCWRWLKGREESPWYPTLRLFRQPRLGDWESVIARVTEELGRYAGAR